MWGNSLAVRIPAEFVELLSLQPGQEAQIEVTADQKLLISRDSSREDALQTMYAMSFVLPEDYVFNRDELHER